MSQKNSSNLVFHGALVFLVGMIAGFPYATAVIAGVGEATDAYNPEAVRGWRMAHLEGILNGLMLIAIGAAARAIRLSSTLEKILVLSLIITAWGNIVASIIGPVFGVRGLAPGGSGPNMLMYVLFMVAVLTILVAMALVAKGAWSARSADDV